MKQLSLLVVVLLLIAVGAFWLHKERSVESETPLQNEVSSENEGMGETGTVRGAILSIDKEAIAYDGPLLLVVESAGGQATTIAIPSMGFNLCAAKDAIADPFALTTGQTIEVRGAVDEEGRLTPCQSSEHYLKVVTE